MLCSLPINSWGSTVSPAFATEVPDGLQLVSLLPEHDFFGSQEHIPSIDESVFDDLFNASSELIPDLEDVLEYVSAPLSTEQFLLDEIPPLEDPSPLSPEYQWQSSPSDQFTHLESPAPDGAGTSPTSDTTPIMFEEDAYMEEVVSGSPVSLYVESCGSTSPASCYSLASEIPEKKRRISQISQVSTSSFNSQASPAWSPSGSEQSDYEPSRKSAGGRRPKFTPADRKERKKAQNRTAAERYRQKRKEQEDQVGEEEQGLLDTNVSLKTEVAKLEAEVSCLKRLMRDMLKAKGVQIPPKKSKK